MTGDRAVLPDGLIHVTIARGNMQTLCGSTRWTAGDRAAADAEVSCPACRRELKKGGTR